MELKKGYKQTEVGVIPSDWDVIQLGEIFDFKNGLNKEKKFFGTGTPIVNYMDVYKHRGLTVKDLTGKVTVSTQELNNYSVKKGDVFFTRTSETVDEIGIASVVVEDVSDTVFSGFVLRARPKNDTLENGFTKYCFSTRSVRSEITSKSSYTTRALTNGRYLSQVKLTVPIKSEQTAIAKALSDADALITSLEKLIAKKRNIKLGAMQQLLTGKRRIAGFEIRKGFKKSELGDIPNDWNVKKFEDVLEGFSSGQTPYRAIPEFYKGDIPWITSGELNYNVITDTIEKITIEGVREANLKMIPKGTFLFAITGLEAAGTRGSCAITGIEATTNQSCMALYPKKGLLTTPYLYQYYLRYGSELAFKYCQGTKQQSFTGGIAKTLPIIVPSNIEEQTAIATILSDMDYEIIELEEKHEKQKKIKQGMMQNLLTGKIRLV